MLQAHLKKEQHTWGLGAGVQVRRLGVGASQQPFPSCRLSFQSFSLLRLDRCGDCPSNAGLIIYHEGTSLSPVSLGHAQEDKRPPLPSRNIPESHPSPEMSSFLR